MSSNQHQPAPHERSLARGLIAGAIGGLVATAAKTFFERIYPAHSGETNAEAEPSLALAQKLAGHTLNGPQRAAAVRSIEWGFGAISGAAYGALAEYYPAAAARDGAAFGLALESLTHDRMLPALHLTAPAAEQTIREHTSHLTGHVVYGMVTETMRRFLRRLI